MVKGGKLTLQGGIAGGSLGIVWLEIGRKRRRQRLGSGIGD